MEAYPSYVAEVGCVGMKKVQTRSFSLNDSKERPSNTKGYEQL